MAQPGSDRNPQEAVAAYKRMLADIIEKRPSGTRQRLAAALAKNRSFVSQITNPAYATPIPASPSATATLRLAGKPAAASRGEPEKIRKGSVIDSISMLFSTR
mgnify:CR=1 FL=1